MSKLPKKWLVLGLIFSLCLGFSSAPLMIKAKSKSTKITVTYLLKKEDQTLSRKKIKLAKNQSVLAGLKKGWSVKLKDNFITSIDGRQQKPTQKLYWTYTVNGKMVTKNVRQQKLKNHDKVTFTLGH